MKLRKPPQCIPITQRMIQKQSHDKDVWAHAWDVPLSHIYHSSLPACTVGFRHRRAAEIPPFTSRISSFQIRGTHSFLSRKNAEGTAMVGKKNNSGWFSEALFSRKILRWHFYFTSRTMFSSLRFQKQISACRDNQKAGKTESGQHPLEDRKKVLVSYFPFPPSRFLANVNGGSCYCHYFEHPSTTISTVYYSSSSQ